MSVKQPRTEYARLIGALGWSSNFAARWLGVSVPRSRYWATGINSRGNPATPPSPQVHAYLMQLGARLRAVDKPTDI